MTEEATPHHVFTIGHSTMNMETFLQLIAANDIQKVLDVRSQPYSRRLPHFNQPVLAKALATAGTRYTHLGKELGGRPASDRLYDNQGRADYLLMAQEPIFIETIKAIQKVAPHQRMALLCTEQDPINCHRALLVAQALHALGVPVTHILRSGETEPHSDTIARITRSRQAELTTGDGPGWEQSAVTAQAKAVSYRRKD